MRARHFTIALAFPLSACTALPGGTTASPAMPLATLAFPTPDVRPPAESTPAIRTPADCPPSDPSLEPDFQALVDEYGLFPEDGPVLAFLNNGGSLETALDQLQTLDWPIGEPSFRLTDLTGDAVPELVLGFDNLFLIGCGPGRYETKLRVFQEDGPVRLEAIQDMNLDGLPEIVAAIPVVGVDLVKVFTWDGAAFGSLVFDERTGWDSAEAQLGLRLEDFDGNGTIELLTDNTDIPQPYQAYFDASCWAPVRVVTDIFSWDGERFTPSRREITPPIYRFQAVQDGDRLALAGRYDEARQRYQQAIDDEALDWWSPDRRDYLLETQFGLDRYGFPSPPEPNPYERISLSAYATYRLLVLEVFSGDLRTARAHFESVQGKANTETAWHVFSLLGTEFWEEQEATNDLAAACKRAVAFVESSPVYLDEVFWAVRPGRCVADYVPADVCPFQ